MIGSRVLAVLLVLAVAGCGSDLVSPLPVAAPGPSPSTVVTPGPAPSPSPSRPTPTRARPSPSARSACWGAIQHDLDLRTTELALVRSMCFAVGGILRVQGIGPGELTVEPERLVSSNYEAGVVDIRFVRPGTVTVTIPQQGRLYPITVVVR
ncbi:hypothetical protein F4553_007428 [Allocatelliglobosispora scoriae]|uniref:Uncharacterized protein n=1 Tax=Allocatelliglobosispora scoriae TaxID=643052 RepID=A0A841C0U1_9ACTN|nr:hypothetical protein [Allocatelliglobosispora scoriae]MBB5873994.1 hypothetical protein [Allocatelliglobosispora scoriae]